MGLGYLYVIWQRITVAECLLGYRLLVSLILSLVCESPRVSAM